nr:hypothetical protein [Lachnospiraceae bacterium]
RINIRKHINTMRKYLWFVGVVTLFGFLIALIVKARVKDNIYKASTSVYTKNSDESTDSLNSYTEIIKSRKVADRAALIMGDDSIKGEDIQKMVDYSSEKDSSIYYIYAYSDDVDTAILVANAITKAFVIEVNNITGEDNIKVLDEAYGANLEFDGRSDQINGIFNITLIAFIISVVLVLLYSIFSGKTVSINDASLGGEIEILGVIPGFDVE